MENGLEIGSWSTVYLKYNVIKDPQSSLAPMLMASHFNNITKYFNLFGRSQGTTLVQFVQSNLT
jgi:hypothetical protein